MQAARGAGCVITEKHDHSLPVSYASSGDEASVSWGWWDLRFYNPSASTTLTFYVTTDATARSCTISCSVT
jgi:vancomycin resistance protein YoaR